MSCALRAFCWFVPVLAWIVLGVLAPCAVQADVVFDGTVSPAASGDWNADTECYVGQSGGSGTALINGGVGLDCRNGYIGCDAVGAMTVSGVGSTWTMHSYDVMPPMGIWEGGDCYVGYGNGDGALVITDGGAVSGRFGYIGYSSDSTGSVTVSDGATWTNESITLRYNSTLMIESGGTVNNTSGSMYIGKSSSSTATVSGAGALLNSSKTIGIGYMGSGDLNIESGGTVEAWRNIVLSSTSHLDLNPGGTLLLDIEDADNSTIDIGLNATVDFGGTVALDLADVTIDEGLWTMVMGDGTMNYESTFALATSGGAAFTELNDVWTYTSGQSLWTFSEGTGQLSLTAVPEPTTLSLLAFGLVGLLAYAWRKRK